MHQKLQNLSLFDAIHVSYLLAWILLWFFIPYAGKKYVFHQKKIASGMVAFIIIQEIIDYWNRSQFRDFSFALDLPLHFCHISLIFVVIILIRPNQLLFELSYYWGLGGALQAMLSPDMSDFDNHLSMFLFFAHHGAIIMVCLWMIVINRTYCRKYAILKTMILSNLIMIPVYFIDKLVDGNYMYLLARPPTESPLVFGDWPWYILNVEIIAILMFNLLNIPMILLRKISV